MTAAGAFPRGRTAFAGAATFGIGECPGYTALEMAAQAGYLALDDAGLTVADVDALFVCLPDDFLSGLALAEYYGIRPAFTDNNRTGGSSFLCHAISAALALDAGLCDVALVTYGSNQRTASGGLISALRSSAVEAPHRPMMPVAGYALAAMRHMHLYGTSRGDLAAVALAANAWAQLNPEAFGRAPLTEAAYFAARMVSTPLGVKDCCLVTDGAAAVVMTRLDRARDLAKPPIALLGGAAEVTHKEIAAMPDLTVTAAARSGARAYAHAGVVPGDIDVVQLYDAFTINTILFLEDLGFCAKGEGGAFVSSGAIAPGGSLPVNTNGGGLSCVHPGMYGLFTMVEAIRQLRGEAGARQVPGAELALCHGNGGVLSSQATLVLGTSATV
ncbi:acetyl-CoA acetyltransferase [Roseibacterium sp. SDUM158016]|uniref:acetyl-CoA acetyltransferase n=1 Tax=Roseicyclus sediminis TaxID=2980997 RepID=UPI0021CED843|nr:acetyl-CoA acetyltransferase [Roseibacterium sp. SDUM158016]MCU4652099.1 acetyl-CoA acetyltransferase [Roseibacterium sp. SDUM158016]